MNTREIGIMVSLLYGRSHDHNTTKIWLRLASRTQLLLKRSANCEITFSHLHRNFFVPQE